MRTSAVGSPSGGFRPGLPAHADPVPARLAQPGQIRLAGDARVQYHRRLRPLPALRPGQPLQRVPQRARLGDVAGQDLAAAREARPVQRQRQAHQRAVAALLLRPPEASQGLILATGVVRVREIVEDDRGGQLEQLPLASEEALLEPLAVRPQQIAGAVQLRQRKALAGVEAEQFEGRAAGFQPAERFALAGRVQHAGGDQGGGDGGVAGGGAGLPEQLREAELVEGVQADALGADRAGVFVSERVEQDGGPRAGAGGGGEAAGAQLLDERLGDGADGGRVCQQRLLAGQQVLDAAGQVGPQRPLEGELGAEVEQGCLADLAAAAYGMHEAEAEAGPAGGGVGLGGADEHGGESCDPSVAEGEGRSQGDSADSAISWHYIKGGQSSIRLNTNKIRIP